MRTVRCGQQETVIPLPKPHIAVSEERRTRRKDSPQMRSSGELPNTLTSSSDNWISGSDTEHPKLNVWLTSTVVFGADEINVPVFQLRHLFKKKKKKRIFREEKKYKNIQKVRIPLSLSA